MTTVYFGAGFLPAGYYAAGYFPDTAPPAPGGGGRGDLVELTLGFYFN